MLQGKVVLGGAVVTNVFIINKVTGAEVKSDGHGLFVIPAKIGDQLVVYNDRIEVREFSINKITIAEVPFVMEVKQKLYELDEVVITQKITPESLGLVPKNQKQYTVAERRLYTAGGMEFGFNMGLVMSLDGLINAITGRTKMLRKALVTERKEFAADKINGLYTDRELIDDLKIPEEYLRGFIFYVVEDAACAKALKSKSDDLAKLLIMELAVKYNALLTEGGITRDALNTE